MVDLISLSTVPVTRRELSTLKLNSVYELCVCVASKSVVNSKYAVSCAFLWSPMSLTMMFYWACLLGGDRPVHWEVWVVGRHSSNGYQWAAAASSRVHQSNHGGRGLLPRVMYCVCTCVCVCVFVCASVECVCVCRCQYFPQIKTLFAGASIPSRCHSIFGHRRSRSSLVARSSLTILDFVRQHQELTAQHGLSTCHPSDCSQAKVAFG